MGSFRKGWRELAPANQAEELAETAMVLPLLFLFVIGIFWFGQAFRIYGTLTNAARDGVRAAVNPGCTTCATIDPSATAWTVIQNDLTAAHINPQLLQQPTAAPTLCACAINGGTTSCATTATVACDTQETNICVQGITHTGIGNAVDEGLVQLSSTVPPAQLAAGGAGECGISVSFQYPYQFWLPFSSIGGQTYNLRAQAQMRSETQ